MNKTALFESQKKSFKNLMGEILNTKGGRAALRWYLNDPKNYNSILKMVLSVGNKVLAAPEMPPVNNVSGIIEKRAAFIDETTSAISKRGKLALMGALLAAAGTVTYKTLKKENTKLSKKKSEAKVNA